MSWMSAFYFASGAVSQEIIVNGVLSSDVTTTASASILSVLASNVTLQALSANVRYVQSASVDADDLTVEEP